MGTYYVGTTGDLTFGTVDLLVTSWKMTDEAVELDVTTVGSGGYHALTTGKRSGSGEAEAIFDGDINYGTPPCLKSGSSGSFILAISTDIGSPTIEGTCVVTSCDYTHDLDGVFKYSVKFKTSGTYTVPGE